MPSKSKHESGKGPFSISVDIEASLFSEDAVMATCHQFTGRAHTRLTQPNRRHYHVILSAREGISLTADAAAAFMDALLDNEMRTRIARSTGAVRDVLVQTAFRNVTRQVGQQATT